MADTRPAAADQQASEAAPHDSARKHVTGNAVYVDDLNRYQNQIYIAIGGSEIACGSVRKLSLEAVWRCDGVVDVLTPADLPAQKDIGAVFPGDPLLTDVIEFMGQALFAVAATSHAKARKAVQAAQVEYQEQDPLLSITSAIEQKNYVRPAHVMGDSTAQTAVDAAPCQRHGVLFVGGQEHFYLEGQVALAMPEEDGGVTVHSSNQNPTEAQKLIAEVLGKNMQHVNVVTRRMGGGFGGKETQAAQAACLAALFAVRNQCPAACRLSRRDDMIMTGKRHPFRNEYTVGFDVEGNILAVTYQLAGQCGHSPDLSDAIVDRAMFHCDNAYYLPQAYIEGLRLKSNTVSNTAFRGFGGPQGMIAMEAVIDEVAFALGKDPLDIRRQNFYGKSSRNLTPYGQRVKTFTVPAIVDQLETESNYRQRRSEIRNFNQANRILKRGIALTPVKFGISFTVKHLNQAGALLHLYSDGSLHLNHGGTEMGQGLMIKVAQIVARVLGADLSNIEICATRTDKVPNTSATAASSGTDLNGMAAQIAAEKIKQRLIAFLVSEHGVKAQQITFAKGRVSAGAHSFSLAEVANQAYLARVPLSATGYYRTPDIHYDRSKAQGEPFYYYANGAAVAEVIIDTLTGESRVLRVDIIHDVGDSINPDIDIGQIEGGFIQGMGWLTTEELKWNEQGRLLTDGPATYKIPAIADRPLEFNVRLLKNTPNEVPTVLRSKAVGEPPLMLAISVHSAIRDAIAAVADYRVFPKLNAPATAEEILRCSDTLKQAMEEQHALA